MFGPKNPEIACGMWSLTYIIALIVVITFIVGGLYISRKMTHKGVKNVLIFDAVFTSTTEIIKMIFIGSNYGIKKVEFVPLYFCSLFIYMSSFALSKNETIKKTGLAFLFYGGIVGALCFFIYPSACIPNYPIYHFMCIRTFMYHGLMIYTGILIVMRGYYTPCKEDIKKYVISLTIISLLAYICNNLFGYDYMYISKPMGLYISQVIYDFNPYLYPFLAMIVEVSLPVIVTSLAYKLIKKIKAPHAETVEQ